MTNQEPLRCPACNSRNISADSFEQFSAGYASRKVTCENCNYEWSELFEFIGIENVDDRASIAHADEENVSDVINFVLSVDTDNDEQKQYMLHVDNPDTFHTDLEYAVIGWIKRMRARGSTAAMPRYTDVLLDCDVKRQLAASGIRIIGNEGDFASLDKDTIFDHLPKYSPLGRYRLASSVITQLQNIVHKYGDIPIILNAPGVSNDSNYKFTLHENTPAIHLDIYTY